MSILVEAVMTSGALFLATLFGGLGLGAVVSFVWAKLFPEPFKLGGFEDEEDAADAK